MQSHLNAVNEIKNTSLTNFLNPDKLSASNLLNSSGMAFSYFPNPEQVKNERDSLQRIHTFSLKEPVENDSDDQLEVNTNILDPLLNN